MIIWLILIFIISFILAFRSMHDFNLPKEIRHLLDSRRIKGTIVFFKDKTKHYQVKKPYSSDSSRSSDS